MGHRAAVLLCAFSSTSLQISGLAWDLEQLEVKPVCCSFASHLHSKNLYVHPQNHRRDLEIVELPSVF